MADASSIPASITETSNSCWNCFEGPRDPTIFTRVASYNVQRRLRTNKKGRAMRRGGAGDEADEGNDEARERGGRNGDEARKGGRWVGQGPDEDGDNRRGRRRGGGRVGEGERRRVRPVRSQKGRGKRRAGWVEVSYSPVETYVEDMDDSVATHFEVCVSH